MNNPLTKTVLAALATKLNDADIEIVEQAVRNAPGAKPIATRETLQFFGPKFLVSSLKSYAVQARGDGFFLTEQRALSLAERISEALPEPEATMKRRALNASLTVSLDTLSEPELWNVLRFYETAQTTLPSILSPFERQLYEATQRTTETLRAELHARGVI